MEIEWLWILWIGVGALIFLGVLAARERNRRRRLQAELDGLKGQLEPIRQQTEELGREVERLTASGMAQNDLLAMVGHDLKNPLTVIVGCSDLLIKHTEAETNNGRYARMIFQSGNQMQEMLTELQKISHLDRGKIRLEIGPLDLGSLVREAVAAHRGAADRKNQSLSLSTEAGCLAAGDPEFVRDVVDNLVSNAIKFSPPGLPIQLRLAGRGDRVRLEVEDKGPGLPAAERAQLFHQVRRFSAVPTGGESSYGLGLYLGKKIIDHHGGKIGVETSPGRGSTFWLELPRPPGPAPSEAVNPR